MVGEQIGDVDLARVLRDDEAWAARLAEIEPHFEEDFEFVVVVPGEPVTGKGFDEFRVRFRDWIEPWDLSAEHRADSRPRRSCRSVAPRSWKDPGTDRDIEGPRGLVLYSFLAGRVTRVEYYFDRDQGLRAAD